MLGADLGQRVVFAEALASLVRRDATLLEYLDRDVEGVTVSSNSSLTAR